MKTCPVCRSRCFDDMSVCYGCMHDFGRDIPDEDMPEEAVLPKPPTPSRGSSSMRASGASHASGVLPSESQGSKSDFASPVAGVSPCNSKDVHVSQRSASAAVRELPRSAFSLPIPMLTSVKARGEDRACEQFGTSVRFEGRGMFTVFEDAAFGGQGTDQKQPDACPSDAQGCITSCFGSQGALPAVTGAGPSPVSGQNERQVNPFGSAASESCADFGSASPWFSIETSGRCRLVFRLEPV